MYSIDIGNAYTVSFNGKTLEAVNSILTTVPSRTNLRQGDGVIEYQGSLYHAGVPAMKYSNYRLLAERDKQLEANMLDNLLLALVVLSPTKGRVPEELEIVLQVPSTLTSYQHDLVKLFNGQHVWTYNGKQHNTRIKVLRVYQEGYGSWYVAKRSRLLPPVGYSLVVDIGGGTAIVSMIDNESGEVQPAVSTYNKRGVIGLVNLLRGDLDLRLENNNDIPQIEQLFEGIETGSYQLGFTGASFKKYYDHYLRQWWQALFQGAVVNDFKDFFTRRLITKVLITGGGAEMVRPLIVAAQSKPGDAGKLFAIANDPLCDNVKGIYYDYADQV